MLYVGTLAPGRPVSKTSLVAKTYRLEADVTLRCLAINPQSSKNFKPKEFSRLLAPQKIKRFQWMTSAYFLNRLFHSGPGGFQALLDRVRNLRSLFSNPGLRVVDEFINLALA